MRTGSANASALGNEVADYFCDWTKRSFNLEVGGGDDEQQLAADTISALRLHARSIVGKNEWPQVCVCAGGQSTDMSVERSVHMRWNTKRLTYCDSYPTWYTLLRVA